MTQGVVKFFNTTKGFGFISPDDGTSDIFVHISAIQDSGLEVLNEGDSVAFEIARDRRSGKIAAANLTVLAYAPPRSGRSRPPGGGSPREGGRSSGAGREPVGSGTGLVKWFNTVKGFGFIRPDDGGEDVFVHIKAVERAGLGGLADGQQISFDLEQDRLSGKVAATNLRVE